MKKGLILRISFLVLFIALLTFLFVHYDLIVFFTDKYKLVNFIKAYHPYDAVVFILIQIIQVVAAPIPGEITGIIGGYIYGPVLGTIYSTIGLTLGSWIAFMLARFFGEPLLEKVVKREVLKKFDHFMEHQGLFVSFLLFLIPGFPKDYLCYIMGVSLIPTWTFLLISTLGRLFGTAMLSVCGSCYRNEEYLLLAVIAGIGVAVFAITWLYREKILVLLKRKKS